MTFINFHRALQALRNGLAVVKWSHCGDSFKAEVRGTSVLLTVETANASAYTQTLPSLSAVTAFSIAYKVGYTNRAGYVM